MSQARSTMTALVPCLLDRKIVPKVWGGRGLEAEFGWDVASVEPIGETWEVYDRPDGSSQVRGSDLTLHDLMQRDPVALLGQGVAAGHGGRFPLAVKFVDAGTALSVQVHPGDAQALEEDDSGKSEAWFVVRVGAEGCIRRGLRTGVTAQQFREALADERLADLLETFRPAVGDAIHVPAGTVHAIGPDVVVWEVQQNSDVTYRLYDWGRPREIHVDKALRATRFDRAPARTTQPRAAAERGRWVVEDDHFRVCHQELEAGERAPWSDTGTFRLLTALRGTGELHHEGGEPLSFRAGDTVLVPACSREVAVVASDALSLLVTHPG